MQRILATPPRGVGRSPAPAQIPSFVDTGLTEFIEFASDLAARSGEVVARYFGVEDLAVETKPDASPVTRADRRAEEVMRDLIRARYPDHGIVGEEFGSEAPDSELVWWLDPIDGTISFTAGSPLFGTLIALTREGEPVLGVIHQPVVGQLVIGTLAGTTLNGRPVRVRDTADLGRATLLTTDLDLIAEHQDEEAFSALIERTGRFRTWGDCYGYLLVASGRADIMTDPIMNAWDLLPLVPIIRGAGGVISTWSGGDAVGGDSCVAATPGLHGQVMSILNEAGG